MEVSLADVAVLVLAYLLGSIDFAVVVARSAGVDIYSAGSGNPGASNVMRTLGRKHAAAVLVLDALKGLLPVLVAGAVGGQAVAFAAGLLAVAGHCYPVFHRFKGGKGAATSAGALLGTMPWVALVLFAGWGVIVGLTRVSSLGSLFIALGAIPGAWLAGVRGWALVWLAAMVLLVLWRHRGNIGRILSRSERTLAATDTGDGEAP